MMFLLEEYRILSEVERSILKRILVRNTNSGARETCLVKYCYQILYLLPMILQHYFSFDIVKR